MCIDRPSKEQKCFYKLKSNEIEFFVHSQNMIFYTNYIAEIWSGAVWDLIILQNINKQTFELERFQIAAAAWLK